MVEMALKVRKGRMDYSTDAVGTVVMCHMRKFDAYLIP